MDLDDFKATWQAYEQKLDSAQQSGQQLLTIILRNQSKSTIDKMIRELRMAYVILIGIVLVFSAIIAGNPFDYTHFLHYIPACGYILIAGTGLYFTMRHNNDLRRTTLGTNNLHQALTELIRLRTRHTELMSRVWIMGMLAGSMIMLPNIARKFSDEGWVTTGLLILLPIAVTAVSAGLARMAGLFTDHYRNELEEQVRELDQLL